MFSYREIGNIDVSALKQLFVENNDWDNEFTRARVSAFQVHNDTAVIPVMWSLKNLDQTPEHIAPKTHFYDKYYIPEFFDELSDKLKSFYNKDGYFIRIVYALLNPGGVIHPHIDGTPTLVMNHRIHVPIVTNKDVVFTVKNVEKNIPEGLICEINNDMIHGVNNNSDMIRIHLIVDWHTI